MSNAEAQRGGMAGALLLLVALLPSTSTGYLACTPPSPSDIDICQPSGPIGAKAPGSSFTLRTSPTTSAFATNCSLSFQGQDSAYFKVTFKSLRLSPVNYFTMSQLGPSGVELLLAAAAGPSLPPAVTTYCNRTLTVGYFTRVEDPHDPVLCDGVVATVTVVAARGCGVKDSAAAAAGQLEKACSLAASCGACASVPGCVWCDDKPALTGSCMYTGLAMTPALNEGLQLPPPQGVCANTSVFVEPSACRDPAEAALWAAKDRALKEAAALGGLAASCGPAALAAARELGAVVAAAAPAEFRVVRLNGAVVIGLYHVASILFLLVIRVKRTIALQQGKPVAQSVEYVCVLLCVVKLLEFYCLVLAQSLIVGDLPVAYLDGTDALLNALAAYAGDAQYAVLAFLAFMCSLAPKGSKHGPCLVVMLAAPACAMGLAVGVIQHFYRVSPLLGASPSLAAGLPQLAMQVCTVPTSALAPSGAFVKFDMPVFAPTMYVVNAFLFLLTIVMMLTAHCMGIAAEDLESTTPIHFRPPLVRSVGATMGMLSHTVEVAAVLVARCSATVTTATNIFDAVYTYPSFFQLIGVFVVLAGSVWQVRLDSRITPGAVKEGLKIRNEEQPAETGGVNVKI